MVSSKSTKAAASLATCLAIFTSMQVQAVVISRISESSGELGSVREFIWAPDSRQVVYIQETGVEQLGIYSAVAGLPGSSVLLRDPVSQGELAHIKDPFHITPDSAMAVFASNMNDPREHNRWDNHDLFSVRLGESGSQVQLNQHTGEGGTAGHFEVLGTGKLTPDGTRVLYTGELYEDRSYIRNLYAATVGQPDTEVQVNPPLPTQRSDTTYVSSSVLATNGNDIVYIASANNVGDGELFSARLDNPGHHVQLSLPPVSGGDVVRFMMTPDEQRIVYGGNLHDADVFELYSAEVGVEMSQVRLGSVGAGYSWRMSFHVDPAGENVIYLGYPEDEKIPVVYSTRIGEGETQVVLSESNTLGGNVDLGTFLGMTADGARALYRGDLRTDGVIEFFSAQIGVAGSQIAINDPPVVGGQIEENRFAQGGAYAVYRGDLEVDGRYEVFSARTDQPGTQVKLSEILRPASYVSEGLELSPDGTRVLYHGHLEEGAANLYMALVGVEDSQVRITDISTPDLLTHFWFSPDGEYIMYIQNIVTNTDHDFYEQGEALFAVPVAGGAPIRLSDQLMNGGRVRNYLKYSPDGRKVAFLAESEVRDRYDLFVATVPEPGTLCVLGCGVVCLLMRRG